MLSCVEYLKDGGITEHQIIMELLPLIDQVKMGSCELDSSKVI